MTTTAPELDALVGRCIGEVAAAISSAELGVVMGDRLIAEIPEFADSTDEDFRAGIIRSCTSNLEAIRETLVTGSPVEDIRVPAGATAWAHELVHRGMPLAALLRAYRLGHELFEETFELTASRVALDPDLRWRVRAGATRRIFRYIDIVCTQLVAVYEGEREQWLRGAAARQAKVAQAIVAGEPVDAAEAATVLGHDVTAAQLGLIVWREAEGVAGETARPLVAIARAVAAGLGGAQTLAIPMGDHAAWAWTTARGLTTPSHAAAVPERVRVAVGTVHRGLEGMRCSHHEARAARRVGDLFGAREGSVSCLRAVALTSLVTADPEQAVSFATAELGPDLGADTDAMRRLRATLRAHLDERLSPSRTARRLGVHQNTVIYRVKRAEELLGHPLDDRRLELEIALRIHEGLENLRHA